MRNQTNFTNSGIKRPTLRAFLTALFLMSLLTTSGQATVVKMTTEDLTNEAKSIVVTRVTDVNAAWSADGTNIFTTVTVAADQRLKGLSGTATIQFRVPGGEVDGMGAVVSDMPVFKVDEEVILFMDSDESRVVGGFQGKYLVKEGFVVQENMLLSSFTSMITEFLERPESEWSGIRERYERRRSGKSIGLQTAPTISSFSPTSASAGTGTIVTISGSNFGVTQDSGKVEFTKSGSQWVEATIITWSDTEIKCLVPINASSGPIRVTNNASETATSSSDFSVTFGFGSRKWAGSSPTVTYNVNANTLDISGTDEYTAITAAFSEWNTESGANFSFSYGGATSTDTTASDGQNTIYWGSIDEAGGTLAQNTYWYYTSTGTIIESDIEFDDAETWSLDPGSGEWDVQTVATHELGHTFSFSDLYGTGDSGKTMYGYGTSGPGGVDRTISSYEKDGAKAIYGYSGQTSSLAGGNWLELNVNSDYASTADATELDIGDVSTEDLTLEAWIYPRTAPSSGNYYVIAAKSDFNTDRGYELVMDSDRKIQFRLSADGSSVTTLTSTTAVSLNTWTHVKAIFDNGTNNAMLLYINGSHDTNNGVDGFTSNVYNSTAAFVIGGYSGGSEFDGRIDEARVSDTDRWVSTSIADALPCSFDTDSNTRGFWKINEAVGSSSFADHSGIGNNIITTGGSDYSLPIGLSSFMVTAGDGQVTLRWMTESEVNNLGFNIYRSLKQHGDYIKINGELIKGAGSSAAAHTYSYIDKRLTNSVTYWYKLEDVDLQGQETMHGPVAATPGKIKEEIVRDLRVPDQYALLQNYPNPFNLTTEIKYQLPEGSQVTLKVYDILGQLVSTLVDKAQPAGFYTVRWDGKDKTQNEVSSGVYLYQLKTEEFVEERRMLLLR